MQSSAFGWFDFVYQLLKKDQFDFNIELQFVFWNVTEKVFEKDLESNFYDCLTN